MGVESAVGLYTSNVHGNWLYLPLFLWLHNVLLGLFQVRKWHVLFWVIGCFERKWMGMNDKQIKVVREQYWCGLSRVWIGPREVLDHLRSSWIIVFVKNLSGQKFTWMLHSVHGRLLADMVLHLSEGFHVDYFWFGLKNWWFCPWINDVTKIHQYVLEWKNIGYQQARTTCLIPFHEQWCFNFRGRLGLLGLGYSGPKGTSRVFVLW